MHLLHNSGSARRYSVLRCASSRSRASSSRTSAGLALGAQVIATAMLSRWGASEITFKHIKERHPYHYHPGFGLAESERQDIANPAVKAIEQQTQIGKTQLGRLYKQ